MSSALFDKAFEETMDGMVADGIFRCVGVTSCGRKGLQDHRGGLQPTDQADTYMGPPAPESLRFSKLVPHSSERAVPDQFWLKRDETPPPSGGVDGDEDVDD
jgi:hypothetical protein